MLTTLAALLPAPRAERDVRSLRPIVAAIRDRTTSLRATTPDLGAALRAERSAIDAALAPARADHAAACATYEAADTATARRDARDTVDAAERALRAAERAALDAALVDVYALVTLACERLLETRQAVLGADQAWTLAPHDVQLLGAIALHHGAVAEMATGEGKTLVATFPLVLRALAGRGAHCITANPYLARRDSEWMGALYRVLGLTVGCVDGTAPASDARRAAYDADITYGTITEFGFDYLRDHMVTTAAAEVQRGHVFALVDEVDAILIDEARTPLIVSGTVQDAGEPRYAAWVTRVARLVATQGRRAVELVLEAEEELEAGRTEAALPLLAAVVRGAPTCADLLRVYAAQPPLKVAVAEYLAAEEKARRLEQVDAPLWYVVDEETLLIQLTERGMAALTEASGAQFIVPDLAVESAAIADDPTLSREAKRERQDALEQAVLEQELTLHVIQQLLRAHVLFQRDTQYLVRDETVHIIDENTGRLKDGRRWSNGLHQAIEAKEGVRVRPDAQSLATITIQHYLGLYEHRAGMTGTALDNEEEFQAVYGMPVVVIPTHRPMIREDRPDVVFRREAEKHVALVAEVQRLVRLALPVLVGTTSVEESERLSARLTAAGVAHRVLNARQDADEARLIAAAGEPGAVTIATNMAGRGTDIRVAPAALESRTVSWCRQHGINPATVAREDMASAMGDGESLADEALVLEPGGLHVLGSARHEARRTDRQLRGRAGRQGEPGASQFFLSFEDALLRPFVSAALQQTLAVLDGMGTGAVAHRVIARAVEQAQRAAETSARAARRRLTEFDAVNAKQRGVVYALRSVAVDGGAALSVEVADAIDRAVLAVVDEYVRAGDAREAWELGALVRRLEADWGLVLPPQPETGAEASFTTVEEVRAFVRRAVANGWASRRAQVGANAAVLEAWALRTAIDALWVEHLASLEHLRDTITYRGAGMVAATKEYGTDGFAMFDAMLLRLDREVCRRAFQAQVTAA